MAKKKTSDKQYTNSSFIYDEENSELKIKPTDNALLNDETENYVFNDTPNIEGEPKNEELHIKDFPKAYDNSTDITNLPRAYEVPTCLILCMCCNDDLYQKEFEDIMSTWGKRIIDGEFPDIDIWAYTASTDGNFKIDENKHMIYVPSFDGLEYTFDKTVKCLEILEFSGYNYDWILRTNCSTTINLKMLENMLCMKMLDNNKIYIAEPCLNYLKSAPFKYMPIMRGNLILMPNKMSKLLNNSCLQIVKNNCDYDRQLYQDLFVIDDLAISAIFNTYAILRNIKITDLYEVLPIQYMSDIYKNLNMNVYTFAIFNKDKNERRNIRNYYYDLHDRYLDFYYKFYDNLNDDIIALQKAMAQNRYFIMGKYNGIIEQVRCLNFNDYSEENVNALYNSFFEKN